MANEAVDAAFERACELHASGRDDEAKAAYIALLHTDATHFGALTNLGTLLFNSGYRTAARTAYRQAVAAHPANATGRVNYANALYDNGDLYQAQAEYEAALRADPGCAPAHQGLSYALEKLGDRTRAQYHRDLGFRGHAISYVPYRGEGRAIAVLLLLGARGGNVKTDPLLDDRTFFVTRLFADYYDPAEFVPYHSFVFNAIGDAELCGQALEGAAALLARTNAAVVNAPAAVARTGRTENAARLGALSGVVAPRTRSYPRDVLAGAAGARALAADGFRWPLLLRTPGFHTGLYFVEVATPGHLGAEVAELPGETLTAIEFLDARGADGCVRKYRVMIVDGRLYPLHLAISSQWMVHYYTAEMAERPEHRAEEAAFLDDMGAALGARAVAALESIRDTLALDYAGIDFGLDRDGNVLLFEANATMMISEPAAGPLWDYRRPAAERINAAVRAMLLQRSTL